MPRECPACLFAEGFPRRTVESSAQQGWKTDLGEGISLILGCDCFVQGTLSANSGRSWLQFPSANPVGNTGPTKDPWRPGRKLPRGAFVLPLGRDLASTGRVIAGIHTHDIPHPERVPYSHILHSSQEHCSQSPLSSPSLHPQI